MPDGKGIPNQIATREALIGRVEERKELPLFHDLGDFAPFVLGGVDAGGVVGADMQQDDVAGLGFVEDVDEFVDDGSVGFWVVVWVLDYGQARALYDVVVVRPGGVRHVDCGGDPFVKELEADAEGAGAGERLHGYDAAVFDCWAVLAEDELLG